MFLYTCVFQLSYTTNTMTYICKKLKTDHFSIKLYNKHNDIYVKTDHFQSK